MTAPARTGRLVVLEGIDGAGTTTQGQRLETTLTARGRDVHLTREPTTGPIGRLLREYLAGRHHPSDATTLALLFAADRADHLAREIEPALARGALVITDRYYHSSLAYQGTGEDRDFIRTINRRARRPDLTLFLEVPVEIAAARRAADARPDELFDHLETQRAIAIGYRAALAALASEEQIVHLDGTQSLDQVADAILSRVLSL